jgi:SAM-dependent methyltransferase
MSSKAKRKFEPFRFLTRLNRSLRKRVLRHRIGEEWNAVGAFQNRQYKSYESYLEHQKAKLATHDFGNYDVEFRKALRDRLATLEIEWQSLKVLCLAARIGTEVKAFLDLGCQAIGIDLNPGKENQYVIEGDFHHLPFPASSMDVVYTNSLDHAFDIQRIAEEILKVLKPGGLLIVEAVQGRDQGVHPGFFESFFWDNIDKLVGIFEFSGFELTKRTAMTYPWPGEALCFRR